MSISIKHERKTFWGQYQKSKTTSILQLMSIKIVIIDNIWLKGWQNKVEVAIRKYTVVVDAHLKNDNFSIDANLTLFWQAKTLFYIKSILTLIEKILKTQPWHRKK